MVSSVEALATGQGPIIKCWFDLVKNWMNTLSNLFVSFSSLAEMNKKNVSLRSLSLYYGNFSIHKEAELTKYNGFDSFIINRKEWSFTKDNVPICYCII